MIRNIIGTTLILISYLVMGINWFYLLPRGLESMPYWSQIVFIGAFFGGIIKYYKPNSKNKNKEYRKLSKISEFSDDLIDVITGHINNEDEMDKNKQSKKQTGKRDRLFLQDLHISVILADLSFTPQNLSSRQSKQQTKLGSY